MAAQRLPKAVMRPIRILGSLKLTVWLLGLAIVLVFFGTLDQVRIGIREAQVQYFESFIAFWSYPAEWPLGGLLQHLPLPLPGGYTVGPLLAINLVFSHFLHFRISWRLAGVSVIHLGVLLLLIGQLVTNLMQKESYMWLDEGERASHVTSFHDDELYLTRTTGEGKTGVFSVPFDSLDQGEKIEPERFPFEVEVTEVFENADIQPSGRVEGASRYGVNQGIGAQFNLAVRAVAPFRTDDKRDVRTAVVTLRDGETSLGTWLVSNVFEDRFPEQSFTYEGTTYSVGLRFQRTYLPFAITLLDFKHERYPGTNIPKSFSSRIRVDDLDSEETKETTVFMNNPLRHRGLTFYQASFAKQDTASMFQVVRNPGWLLPYISCTLVSIGLAYQFLFFSIRFLRKARS